MLVPVLAITTIPFQKDPYKSVAKEILEGLAKSPDFLRKTINKSKTSLAVLEKLASGDPGIGHQPVSERHDEITNRLQTLLKIATSIKEGSDRLICANCNAKEVKGKDMQACPKCRSVYYCDESCQLSHWKNGHKKECASVCKRKYQELETVQNATSNFFEGNRYAIMAALAHAFAANGNSPPTEVLFLELDFLIGPNGLSPALCSPPLFQIKSIASFLDVRTSPTSRSELFIGCEDQDAYVRGKMSAYQRNKKDGYLITVARDPKGLIDVMRFAIGNGESQPWLFGKESIGVYSRYLKGAAGGEELLSHYKTSVGVELSDDMSVEDRMNAICSRMEQFRDNEVLGKHQCALRAETIGVQLETVNVPALTAGLQAEIANVEALMGHIIDRMGQLG